MNMCVKSITKMGIHMDPIFKLGIFLWLNTTKCYFWVLQPKTWCRIVLHYQSSTWSSNGTFMCKWHFCASGTATNSSPCSKRANMRSAPKQKEDEYLCEDWLWYVLSGHPDAGVSVPWFSSSESKKTPKKLKPKQTQKNQKSRPKNQLTKRRKHGK